MANTPVHHESARATVGTLTLHNAASDIEELAWSASGLSQLLKFVATSQVIPDDIQQAISQCAELASRLTAKGYELFEKYQDASAEDRSAVEPTTSIQ